MLDKLHIIVALFAALVVTIVSMFQDIPFFDLCARLLIVIPIFLVFGLFFRASIRKAVEPKLLPQIDEEQNSEEQPEGEEVTQAIDEEDDFS